MLMNTNSEMGEYRNDRSLENTQYNQTTTFQSSDSSNTGDQFSSAPALATEKIVDTTVFHDASATENDIGDATVPAISLLDEIPSIAAFLKRPTLIASETLSVSTPNQPIFITAPTGRIPMASYQIPNSILSRGGKEEKIQNFRYFKGTCVFKFMTNANPFTQGKFWITVAPNESTTRRVYQQRDKTLASLTSYPGIELDVQTNTSALLRVPFLSEFDAIETYDVVNYGVVNVYSLAPISSPGLITSKLSFQVFGWIEDLELIGPTPIAANVLSQVSRMTDSTAEKVKAQLEVAEESKGPVTEVSSTINGIAKGIRDSPLGAIPMVGTIASAVSWASGAVNKVASIFGWSRPVHGSFSTPMVIIPGRGYGQVKAEDAATVLALANDNAVAEAEINFTTADDEMDIEYVCSRPGVVSSINWIQNTIQNGIIMILPVGPQVVASPTSNNRRQVTLVPPEYRYDMTCFEYISTLFTHWRADIHYRITFTKTAFHTGRVEVFFVPGHLTDIEVDALSLPVLDSTNSYRQIVDITNQNELNVTIPYVSPFPMSRCRTDTSIPSNIGYYNNDTPIGYIVVRQLTPLIMPETVSPFVTVQAWKWASNVTFAGPHDAGYSDVITPQPILKVDAELQVGVETQSDVITQVVWGKPNPENLKASLAVAGERIHNLRALTRAHREMNTSINTNSVINANIGANLGGYVGKISSIFSFYRGGLSLKLMPNALLPTDNTGFCRTKLFHTSLIVDKSKHPMEHTTFWGTTPIHEVMIPFYGFARRMTCNTSLAETVGSSTARSIGVHINSTITPMRALIAGKDDFNLSYLIGPPTQVISSVVN